MRLQENDPRLAQIRSPPSSNKQFSKESESRPPPDVAEDPRKKSWLR
jgi:hypothetical protein